MKRGFLVAFAVLLGGLAGCLEGAEAPAPAAEVATNAVYGWILDDAFRPLQGARIEVAPLEHNTTSGPDGSYRIERLPLASTYTIIAQHAGYEVASVTVLPTGQGLDLLANLTMERIPDVTPSIEVGRFPGFISCNVIVQVGHSHGSGNAHDHNDEDCAVEDVGQDNVWEFPVFEGVQGVVIEIYWDARTSLAEYMVGFLEGVAAGDDGEDVLFDFKEGTDGFQVRMVASQAARYLPQGGDLRLTVASGIPHSEAGAIGAHIQQDFIAYASTFYHQPAPILYRLGEPA